MPLSTADLIGRHDVTSTDLHRWEQYGWIRGLGVVRQNGAQARPGGHGQGYWRVWPEWVGRMVALLALPGEATNRQKGSRASTRSDLMRKVAVALDADADACWLVDAGGVMQPARDGAEAVRLALSQPGPLYTIVSPPPQEAPMG